MSDYAVEGIPCIWMRGGTSKGIYFPASSLPEEREEIDDLLLRVMGSPDSRQIDGIGGADPLTSKAALLSRSTHEAADVDYFFLQVSVDQAVVSDAQGCGNILAGVGPAAIELGLVAATDDETVVRIHMLNTGEVATARVSTPGGRVNYRGEAKIDGVPGHHAAIPLMFDSLAGSMSGALLPTGRSVDEINQTVCTLIDNGMPVVVLDAADFGLSGQESREYLDTDLDLRALVEAIRLEAGPMMNLGDVADKTVPKMTLVSPPKGDGVIATRSFIPHRCHASIGVFAAVSVATACTLPEGPAARMANLPNDGRFRVEHPAGSTEVVLELNGQSSVVSAGAVRTARKLFAGRVFPQPRIMD